MKREREDRKPEIAAGNAVRLLGGGEQKEPDSPNLMAKKKAINLLLAYTIGESATPIAGHLLLLFSPRSPSHPECSLCAMTDLERNSCVYTYTRIASPAYMRGLRRFVSGFEGVGGDQRSADSSVEIGLYKGY